MRSNTLENGFFILVLAVTVFLFVLILKPFLTVIVLAGSLAVVFQNFYNRLHKITGRDFLSSLATVIVVTLIVFIPFAFFGMQLFAEATGQYSAIALNGGYDLGATLNNFLQSNFPSLHIPEISLTIGDSARQFLSWMVNNIGSLTSSVGQFLFTAFLSLLGLFYFLKDGEKLKEFVFELVPLHSEYKQEIMHETATVISSVIKGTLVVAVLQAISAGISFYLFNIPDPIFWGSLVLICSPIPIVGAWLVVLPAIAFLLVTGQFFSFVALAIWSLIAVNVIYNLVAPRLIHTGNDIHPYVIMLGMLGGIAVFGPIGYLVGPLIVALFFSLVHIYHKMIARKEV